jgi:hypothetical protein
MRSASSSTTRKSFSLTASASSESRAEEEFNDAFSAFLRAHAPAS